MPVTSAALSRGAAGPLWRARLQGWLRLWVLRFCRRKAAADGGTGRGVIGCVWGQYVRWLSPAVLVSLLVILCVGLWLWLSVGDWDAN